MVKVKWHRLEADKDNEENIHQSKYQEKSVCSTQKNKDSARDHLLVI